MSVGPIICGQDCVLCTFVNETCGQDLFIVSFSDYSYHFPINFELFCSDLSVLIYRNLPAVIRFRLSRLPILTEQKIMRVKTVRGFFDHYRSFSPLLPSTQPRQPATSPCATLFLLFYVVQQCFSYYMSDLLVIYCCWMSCGY